MADDGHKTDQPPRPSPSVPQHFKEGHDVSKGLSVSDLGISTQTALNITGNNPMAPQPAAPPTAQPSTPSVPAPSTTDSSHSP